MRLHAGCCRSAKKQINAILHPGLQARPTVRLSIFGKRSQVDFLELLEVNSLLCRSSNPTPRMPGSKLIRSSHLSYSCQKVVSNSTSPIYSSDLNTVGSSYSHHDLSIHWLSPFFFSPPSFSPTSSAQKFPLHPPQTLSPADPSPYHPSPSSTLYSPSPPSPTP